MAAPSDNPQPEIPANHRPLAQELIYRTLVLPAVRGEFHRVRIYLDGPPPRPADGPLVIYLTHHAWWDAYLLFVLSYQVLGGGFQNYILMEARQLRAYRFFAWCGAFSIDRTIPGDAERSLAYAANRLNERRERCLWLFPQGRIVPADRRPLVVYPGIARIARRLAGATFWPIALRYEFRGEQQPEALIRCGPIHQIDGAQSEEALLTDIGARLSTQADLLRADLLADQLESYQVLLTGRQGINRWFDGLRARLPGRRRSTSGR